MAMISSGWRPCCRGLALASLFSASAGLTQAMGCSASDGSSGGAKPGGVGTAGSGGGGIGGAAASTGAGAGLNVGGGSMGGMGTGTSADSGCSGISQATETTYQTVDTPVAIYIMQDRSSSMVGVLGDPQRWPDATNGVSAFVNDPASAGLIVGLGFFPGYPGDGSDCSGAGCPKYVDFGALPGNATNITNAYGQATPPTMPPLLTPTECALRGATTECAQYQAANQIPCVVLLVTDGAPTMCDTTTAGLATVASDALANWGVQTYTLGMQGADFTVLNPIAVAGGTDCAPNDPNMNACDISTGGSTAFIDALSSIRTKIVATASTKVDCHWTLPPPPDGGVFDKSQVNLHFRMDSTGQWLDVYKVPTEADCAKSNGVGWYFDNETNPTQVLVCPSTCSTLQGTTTVEVEVILHCPTKMQPIQ